MRKCPGVCWKAAASPQRSVTRVRSPECNLRCKVRPSRFVNSSPHSLRIIKRIIRTIRCAIRQKLWLRQKREKKRSLFKNSEKRRKSNEAPGVQLMNCVTVDLKGIDLMLASEEIVASEENDKKMT